METTDWLNRVKNMVALDSVDINYDDEDEDENENGGSSNVPITIVGNKVDLCSTEDGHISER